MSDILIKNMEMPKCCGVCPLRVDGLHTFQCMRLLGRAYTYELAEQRQEDCPLIEVKPHGWLIDADKLTDIIISCIRDAEKEYPKNDFGMVKMVYESCLYHISKSSIVLEASNGEDS